jgi:hypothetical protein
VVVVHVPAAFPRQVRNDPVGHIDPHFLSWSVFHFPYLQRWGELLSRFLVEAIGAIGAKR